MRALLAIAAALLLTGAAAAAGTAAGTTAAGFKQCGSRPSQLMYNREARGIGCTAFAKTPRPTGKVTVVKPHTYRYRTAGWTCLYTVFHSSYAQDGEGEIFDCWRSAYVDIRWSDASAIRPRSLRK